MTSVSTLSQPRRRKQTTYGKSSRTANTWNLSSLDALDDDDELPAPKSSAERTPKAEVERTRSVKETYSVQKHETKPQAFKPVKRYEKKQDAWDVPSSDDEAAYSPIRRTCPPKLIARRKLVNVEQEKEPQLALWEKKKSEASQVEVAEQKRHRKHAPASSGAQLKSELAGSTREEGDLATIADTPKPAKPAKREEALETSPNKVLNSNLSSAAARLQARRALAGNKSPSSAEEPSKSPPQIQKRQGQEIDTANTTPRKRMRTQKQVEVESMDVAMDDVPPAPAPTCESSAETEAKGSSKEAYIYECPDSSADEGAKLQPKSAIRKATRQKTRRGKGTTYSSPRKMKSAPARLNDMLRTDTDTTDTTTRSPSLATSRPTTPQKVGRSSKANTPETAFRASGTMTPKQAQLWDRLLPSDISVSSPSVLPMQGLTLNGTRRAAKGTSTTSRMLTKSSSDVGRRRTKLVDRLKASAPSSDGESSESEDESSDIEMEGNANAPTSDAGEIDEQAASQQSQSQSQNTITADNGPNITYGRTRSYLPEDSFEDGLLFDLTEKAPKKPAAPSQRTYAKTKPVSQKSAFDLDGSDDEGGSGRLRTIHELRAGGGNQRFMDDIGGLLQDITDHNISARSRRRSALIEIATKLAEKSFTGKFFRQGFERQLLAECASASDDIADFVLAAIFITMMSNEPPEHAAPTFKDAGLLTWLIRLLDDRTDVKKLAKDRRNNMSKAARDTFLDFARAFAGQDVIWGEPKPALMTPRTIALKALDQIIGKLRRSGDKAELVSTSEIRTMLPSQEEISDINDPKAPVDVTLTISALESLSTAALSLAWPADVTERLRSLLVNLDIGNGKTLHLLFLTMRLSLNLTNDNARNCKAFSKPPTVVCLLRSVGEGFEKLYDEVGEERLAVHLDLLVLSMGILINLTEHNDSARVYAATAEATPLLVKLVEVFQQGQERILEAESVEQGVTNVAYGYLAVVLANLCRNREAKAIIASKLPSQNLSALVEAVEEFVMQHQKVDTQHFDGEEGIDVWSAFTEKLKGVLIRLKAEA